MVQCYGSGSYLLTATYTTGGTMCDFDGDNKLGLADIIYSLQMLAGMRNQN